MPDLGIDIRRATRSSETGHSCGDASALVERLAPYDVAGPLPPDSALRRHPRLLATPHLNYVTEAGYRQFYGDVVEDITAFLEGAPVREL